MKSLIKKIGVSIFSSCVAFFLIECMVRLSGYRPSLIHIPDDDPTISYRLSPLYQEGNIKINSYGLRDEEFSIKKSSDEVRIIVIGDSIVFGAAVRLEDTFVKIAQSEIEKRRVVRTKINIINAGVSGYSTFQEVSFFHKYCLKFTPDVVILSYCLNDPEPVGTLIGHKSPFLRKIKNILRYNLRSVYWIFERYYTFKMQYALKKEILSVSEGDKKYDYIRMLYNDNSRGWGETIYALNKLKEISIRYNFKVLVMINPSLDRGTLGRDYPYYDLHKKVANVCSSAGLEVFDLLPYMSKYNPDELKVSPTDGHYNAEGHRIVGELLASETIKRRLIER